MRFPSGAHPQVFFELPAQLKKVEDLTRAAAKEIRHIIFLLRPEGQGDLELISELDSLANKMGELHAYHDAANASRTSIEHPILALAHTLLTARADSLHH